MKKNYNIEKMRFISALMVVSIHILSYKASTNTATFWNYYFGRYIFDFGVIFFFAITGYFIYQKNNISHINKQIKKIASLIIFSTSIYLILNPFLYLIESIFTENNFKTLMYNFLSDLSWNSLFNGTIGSYHLWYFSATLIALYIFKIFLEKELDIISITLISLAVFSIYYLEIVDISAFAKYGGFPKALFSMSIGYLIAYLPYEIKFSNIFSIIVLICGSVLNYKINWGLGNIILYISVALIINYFKYNPGKKSFLSSLGAISLPIYIMHLFIYHLFDLIVPLIKPGLLDNELLRYIILIITIIIFSPILYKLLNNLYENFKLKLIKRY